MYKKRFILLILILLSTGCTSYTELNELSIVNTLGIDYKDNMYNLTINVIDGKIDDDKVEKEFTTFTSKAKTLEEAFNLIYLESSKRLYLSHIDLLILTKEAINEKLIEIIKNFLENNEYRNNFQVILLENNELNNFMNKQISSEDIIELIKTNEKETGFTKNQDLENMMKDLLIDKNSYLPTISYKENKFYLEGITLLKNYKVYKKLSINDTILYNLLTNNIEKCNINNTTIYDNQTIIKIKNNKVNFNFITTISKKDNFVSNLKEDLSSFLNLYQKEDYDILKIKEKIRKENPNYYQSNDILKKLEFNFKFSITEKEIYLKGDLINETK